MITPDELQTAILATSAIPAILRTLPLGRIPPAGSARCIPSARPARHPCPRATICRVFPWLCR